MKYKAFVKNVQLLYEISGLGLRSMISLDPLMGKNGYPLLFQTGETGNGRTTLVDRQHPHDFFMELAATYSLKISNNSSTFIYVGLPGEPALGPTAFMHRWTARDLPEAPLTHHWLDSTHISFGVITVGYILDNFKVESSIFNGREPDQHRWNIESPRLNSVATRLSFNPNNSWSLQVSYGHLKSPEQLEPGVDTNRITASTTYNGVFYQNNIWQTMLAWGRNLNSPEHRLDGYLLESAMKFNKIHTILARFENVQKDGLLSEHSPLYRKAFTINKLSGSYIFDFYKMNDISFGIGGLASIYAIPHALHPVYKTNLISYMGFVRATF